MTFHKQLNSYLVFLLRFFVIGWICTLTLIASSQENPQSKKTPNLGISKSEENHSRSFLSFTGGFVTLSTENESISGLDGSVSFHYAFRPTWSIGAGFQQAFNIAGFGSLYTGVSVDLSYAWLGELVKRQEGVQIDSFQLTQSEYYLSSALISQLSVKQYFFNGSEAVVPFTGLGFSTYYRLASQKTFNIIVGASFDFVFNGETSITPLKVFSGVQFRF